MRDELVTPYVDRNGVSGPLSQAPRSASVAAVEKCTTVSLQGYLAQKKKRPPRTLQEDLAYGPTVALGG